LGDLNVTGRKQELNKQKQKRKHTKKQTKKQKNSGSSLKKAVMKQFFLFAISTVDAILILRKREKGFDWFSIGQLKSELTMLHNVAQKHNGIKGETENKQQLKNVDLYFL